MSKSLNRVTLLGRAGKDPQVHILPSGTVVNLSLATSERFKDSRGEWQERTEWHNLVGYQRIGEILRDYARKGSRLYIEGALRTRSWDCGHWRLALLDSDYRCTSLDTVTLAIAHVGTHRIRRCRRSHLCAV